jgi:hypothetical protein
MVEAACEMARPNGCGDVRACGWGSHPCQFQVHLIIGGVGRQVAIIFIYLKMCYSNGSADVSGPIGIMLHKSDGSTSSVTTV